MPSLALIKLMKASIKIENTFYSLVPIVVCPNSLTVSQNSCRFKFWSLLWLAVIPVTLLTLQSHLRSSETSKLVFIMFEINMLILEFASGAIFLMMQRNTREICQFLTKFSTNFTDYSLSVNKIHVAISIVMSKMTDLLVSWHVST